VLLPTKTSRSWIHSIGTSEIFCSAYSQVASTSWVKGLSRLITVAVILSSVSLLFIALYLVI
jgi:hypothetical protein